MTIDYISITSEDDVEMLISKLFDGVEEEKDATPELIIDRIATQLIIADDGVTYFLSDLQASLQNFLKIKLSKKDTTTASFIDIIDHPECLVHNRPLAEVLYAIYASKDEKRFHFPLINCPITMTPVHAVSITHNEQTIEYYAYAEHVESHGENPFNRQRISNEKILRNFALQDLIRLRTSAKIRKRLELYDVGRLHADLDEMKGSYEAEIEFYNNKINQYEVRQNNDRRYLLQYCPEFANKTLPELNELSKKLADSIELNEIHQRVLPWTSGIFAGGVSLIPVGILLPTAVAFAAASTIPFVGLILLGIAVQTITLLSAFMVGKFIYDSVKTHFTNKLQEKNQTKNSLNHCISAKKRDNELSIKISSIKQNKETANDWKQLLSAEKNKLPPIPKEPTEQKNILSTSKDTLLAAPPASVIAEKEVDYTITKVHRL